MKKIFPVALIMLLFSYTAFSQMDVSSEEVPESKVILKPNQVPSSLKNAVEKSYSTESTFEWHKFPYLLKKYGWEFKNNIDMSGTTTMPDFYEVTVKLSHGGTIDAVYNKEGKMLRSKELLKSMELPENVAKSIENGEYKDCRIVGDKLKITNAENQMPHTYYSVVVEKNNKKHTLYYDKNGKELKNPSL